MSVIKGLQDILIKMGGHPESGDNSDELIRKIADAYDPFIIHLTPISEDFSGFMDKTCAEITEAYNSGKKIIFDIDVSVYGFTEMTVEPTIFTKSPNVDNRVCAQAFLNYNDILIFLLTGDESEDNNQYYTWLYQLTSPSYNPENDGE